MEQKKRDMNFELLRIISMFLIISTHFVVHSGILEKLQLYSFNYFFIEFIRALTMISVNLYILITGYYMIKSKIKIKKWFNIWITVLFYSMFIIGICKILGIEISIKKIIKEFMPISSVSYWFVTVYLVLYILSPFINKFIYTLSKNQYKVLLSILFLFIVVIKTIFYHNSFIEQNGGSSLIWFIYLYLISSYIRLHYKGKVNKTLCLFITLSMPIIIVEIRTILAKLNVLPQGFLWNFVNIFSFASTIAIFLYFKEVKIKNKYVNKAIEIIAPLTFGIYLIHDNNNIRKYIWYNIFHVAEFGKSMWLPLYYIWTVLAIFVVCACIEYIRIKIFELCEKTKTCQKINKKLDKINEKFLNIMNE